MRPSARRRVAFGAVAAIMLASAAATPALAAGIWVQQTAREQSAGCPEGWSPSWAQWPNGNTGGFVCNRYVDDPSANPGEWLFWYLIQVDGTSNNTNGHPGSGTTQTPRCVPAGTEGMGTAPLEARLDPSSAGTSIESVGFMTVVTTTSATDQIVGLNYLCPAGSELQGII